MSASSFFKPFQRGGRVHNVECWRTCDVGRGEVIFFLEYGGRCGAAYGKERKKGLYRMEYTCPKDSGPRKRWVHSQEGFL